MSSKCLIAHFTHFKLSSQALFFFKLYGKVIKNVIKFWLCDYWLPCSFGVFGKVIKKVINWLHYIMYDVNKIIKKWSILSKNQGQISTVTSVRLYTGQQVLGPQTGLLSPRTDWWPQASLSQASWLPLMITVTCPLISLHLTLPFNLTHVMYAPPPKHDQLIRYYSIYHVLHT